MSHIVIAYLVPVDVTVDTETGKVEKVALMREAISPDDHTSVRYADNNVDQPTGIESAEAFDIAADAEWPAWVDG